MIQVKTNRDFSKIEARLKRSTNSERIMSILEKYGEIGVKQLANNTPVNSGKTANSWSYKVEKSNNRYCIRFYNFNVVNNTNIAILIQYGHGTRNGGYVRGIDYINPALKQVFIDMKDELVKEVSRL